MATPAPGAGADACQVLAWVAATPWLMAALQAARSLGLADWAIGAGAVRNLVWDRLHGRAQAALPADVDLVFHDAAAAAAGQAANARHERRLRARLWREASAQARALPWELCNQAAVHLWLQRPDGAPVARLRSVADGVASWPETATAVAVWLDSRGRLQLLAPHGLDDLMALRLRRNATRVDAATYQQRLAAKAAAWTLRWPLLRLEDGADTEDGRTPTRPGLTV